LMRRLCSPLRRCCRMVDNVVIKFGVEAVGLGLQVALQRQNDSISHQSRRDPSRSQRAGFVKHALLGAGHEARLRSLIQRGYARIGRTRMTGDSTGEVATDETLIGRDETREP